VIETQAAFARRQKVSRQAVGKWVARGLPVRNDGQIDVEQGEAFLQKYRSVKHQERKPRPVTAPYEPADEFDRGALTTLGELRSQRCMTTHVSACLAAGCTLKQAFGVVS